MTLVEKYWDARHVAAFSEILGVSEDIVEGMLKSGELSLSIESEADPRYRRIQAEEHA